MTSKRTRAKTRRPGAPTRKELRAEMTKIIKFLRRSQAEPHFPKLKMADQLEDCRRRNPCRSAACLLCSDRHQEEALAVLQTVWPDGTDLMAGTVVIPRLNRGPGKLKTIQLKSIERSLRRKLEAAGCSDVAIWAYIDLSWNEHTGGAYHSHWCPHVQFVALQKHRERLRKGLKRVLKTSKAVKRPFRCDQIKDWDRQVSYVCKPRLTRRIDFDKTSSKASASKKWLKGDQIVEAMIWLREYGPWQRHFMFNMRKQGNVLNILEPQSVIDEKMLNAEFPCPESNDE